MTDAEIIKALECCNTEDENGFANCDDCPYYAKGMCLTCPEIFDLINRQQAEIERLTSEVETQKSFDQKMWATLILQSAVIKSERAEAIKEFAEKLKARAKETVVYKNELCAMGTPFVIVKDIDNLVKEMVGEG